MSKTKRVPNNDKKSNGIHMIKNRSTNKARANTHTHTFRGAV